MDFAAGEKRRWLHELGVRWFPLVQWAERGGYTVPGTATRCRASMSPGVPGPALVDPFPTAVLQSRRVRIRGPAPGRPVTVDGRRPVAGRSCEPSTTARGAASSADGGPRLHLLRPGVVIAARRDRRQPRPGPAELADRLGGPPERADRRGARLRRRLDARRIAHAAGGRVINADRMWHYPEGILNHTPIWSRHGIRILPGPSSLWLDARGARLPAPLFPGFDALGALRHITADRLRLLLVRAGPGDARRRVRALRVRAERRPDRQGPAAARRSAPARARPRRSAPSRARRRLPRRRTPSPSWPSR